MGASLSARFEWLAGSAAATSTTSTPDKGAHLPISVVNQELLHELAQMLEQLCHEHGTEAKAEFRRPLQWTTTLTLAAFGAHPGQWNVQTTSSK